MARLVVACKDYTERYGAQPAEGILGLPHIGWGQRLADFTASDRQFGFTSSGSIETLKEFLEYLARSFGDLLNVRDLAQQVVHRIAAAEPTLAERCLDVESQIAEGGEYLRQAVANLEAGARRVSEVIASTPDFEARRAAAAKMAAAEPNPAVARLLVAVSKLRKPVAWVR